MSTAAGLEAEQRYLLHAYECPAELFPPPADRPTAKTMAKLGRIVAGHVASDEPPSEIVVVEEPTVRDPAGITVDVIGLADDSIGGERLRIVGEPARGGSAFTVRSVESTVLCSRGVSADRLCV